MTSTESPSVWLEPLRESAKAQINAYLGKKIRNYFFLPFNILGNHSTEFSCFIHMTINFADPFDRDEVEKHLQQCLSLYIFLEFYLNKQDMK